MSITGEFPWLGWHNNHYFGTWLLVKGWWLNGVSTVSQNDVFLFVCVTSALYKVRMLFVSHLFEVKGKENTEWVTRLSTLVQLHSITDFLSNPVTISCLLLSWAIKISAIYVLTHSFSHTSLQVDMPFLSLLTQYASRKTYDIWQPGLCFTY